MRSMLKDFLKTPKGDWFKGKLTRHDHFEPFARIDNALNRVPEDFAVEDRCWFMASCFGHFMSMHQEMKFFGGVIHQPLLWELDHDGLTDEMWFLLGNHVVRFSKVEFYLITGLRFGVVPDTGLYAAVENDIHQRYFPRAGEVSLEELRVVLTLGEFQEAYDAMKLCLIYMLNWILIRVEKKFKISVWQFRLMEDLTAFYAFPWAAHVYRHSILSFKHALPRRREERGQQSQGDVVHTIEGYNIYDICFRGDLPVEHRFRRMLKWELTKQPRGKKLAKILSARTTAGGIHGDGTEKEGEGGRCSDTEASDPSGPSFSAMDTDESEPSLRRLRHRRVRFTNPEPGASIGDSCAGVGLDVDVPMGTPFQRVM
ncbi:hypothetical protein Ddye_029156 [Dipteronia dyeriana]|uniref:DUF1985 domain-containing protein n=1 Tax=Dipteronia dyeriana TaxID=168575 RepID=A0AAD9WKC0_9ROSI|nr:hypothetical protein Ddye_029156 [Dipteronia dyeriana]